MPVIKSAIKKYRKDKKLEKHNDVVRAAVEKAVRAAKKTNTPETVSAAFSVVDKAVKTGVFHKNKAARIKSALMKGQKETVKKTVTPKIAKSPKKTPSKKVAK